MEEDANALYERAMQGINPDEDEQMTEQMVLDEWMMWNSNPVNKAGFSVGDIRTIAAEHWKLFDEITNLDDYPTKVDRFQELVNIFAKGLYGEDDELAFRKRWIAKVKRSLTEKEATRIQKLDAEIARLSHLIEDGQMFTGKRIKVGKKMEDELRDMTAAESEQLAAQIEKLQQQLFEIEIEPSRKLGATLYDMLDEALQQKLFLSREEAQFDEKSSDEEPEEYVKVKKVKKSGANSSSSSSSSDDDDEEEEDVCAGCECPSDLLDFLLRVNEVANDGYVYITQLAGQDPELQAMLEHAYSTQQEDGPVKSKRRAVDKELAALAEDIEDENLRDRLIGAIEDKTILKKERRGSDPESSEEEEFQERFSDEKKPKKTATKTAKATAAPGELKDCSNINDCNVDQIKAHCKSRGLKTTWKNKAEAYENCVAKFRQAGGRSRRSRRSRSSSRSPRRRSSYRRY